MASRARERILTATAELIRRNGVAQLTTKQIAQAADAAEGSITKNFGGKGGLLVEVLSAELPELAAWRRIGEQRPDSPTALRKALADAVQPAFDYYAAALPLIATALSDASLADSYRRANAERGSGPMVAVNEMELWLSSCRRTGALPDAVDPHAAALAFCGAAQLLTWQSIVTGTEPERASMHPVIESIVPLGRAR